MIKADYYYLKNLKEILENGTWDENPRPKWKDGTPAHSKFITQVFEEYDLSKAEYPITTLRNTAIKMGIKEMFWIYQKQSNDLNIAHELGIKWWDEWEVENSNIGQRYGATVKRYNLMDNLLKSLKDDPYSRRHIMNMYQESDLAETPGLNPCAYETIWSVRKSKDSILPILDMTLIQRSNDYIMAGYINKIQYVALMLMVASHLGYNLGKFCHLTQNLHIYDRHMDAVEELLKKEPLEQQPFIKLNKWRNFYEYDISNFEVKNIDGITKLSDNLEIAV